jgi:hypothetical protein
MGFLFALLFDGQGNQSRADVEKGGRTTMSQMREASMCTGVYSWISSCNQQRKRNVFDQGEK